MDYAVEPLILNTDALDAPSPAGGLWGNRAAAYHYYDAPGVPKCSIMVQGYNRLEKTQYCVECILKYTQDIDYELILVDNGSDDGTYEFFQSVPYQNKKIIKVTKNIGAGFTLPHILKIFSGKYLVMVHNDVYVTNNWLSNLLKCLESDEKIGFVQPVSSNVSNNQQVDLKYQNFDEMQKEAAAFNHSDPLRWEERMRLISILLIFSRPVLDVVGVLDAAFIHDFSEDDLCARIRRSGYKLVLCGDTWVCHDHDFRNREDKDPVQFKQSLASGRAVYKEKYRGIDAWGDVDNFEFLLLAPLKSVPLQNGKLRSLVIDGRCGTPVLEIRKHLQRRAMTDIESYAFTTQARYYLDLQTVADDVRCDRIDFIQEHYAENTFDVLALCEPINTYPNPILLLRILYSLLKPGGVLLLKLRNVDDCMAFMRSSRLSEACEEDTLPSVLSLNKVVNHVELLNPQSVQITTDPIHLDKETKDALADILKAVKPQANQNDLAMFFARHYLLQVIKQ